MEPSVKVGKIRIGRYSYPEGAPWRILALRDDAVCVINMFEDDARELMLALQEWFDVKGSEGLWASEYVSIVGAAFQILGNEIVIGHACGVKWRE